MRHAAIDRVGGLATGGPATTAGPCSGHAAESPPGWHARLELHYARDKQAGERTLARFRHEGPLRVLQSLYPEGPAICHNVLVHPPSGLVGGDRLDIDVRVDADAHALITTPGATRFYRSEGLAAVQSTRVRLAAGARLEWLPLESICYSGCRAENRLHMALEPGAEMLGWDLTALGLPAASRPFVQGNVLQSIQLGADWREHGEDDPLAPREYGRIHTTDWREHGRIDAADRRLLDGPLGLDGQRCMATLFLAAGSALSRPRRDQALERARKLIGDSPLAARAGATSPHPRVVVVRALAPMVEPAWQLLKAIRAEWRNALWELAPTVPRTWAL